MTTIPSPLKDLKLPVKKIVDMSLVCTLILGGGTGTRLYPLTLTRCKPAICFGGRYRLLDIPMSNALNSGLNKIYILTQFLSASLHQHILKTYRMESHSTGFIEILSAEQKPEKHAWYQGTADAIRQNIEYLTECDVEYFLILSGDQLYKMQFDHMVAFAEETDADLVIATLPVQKADAKRMGILKVNDEMQIIDFKEKPATDEELFPLQSLDGSFLGSMGIYLFKKQALLNLLQEDTREDFGKHLIPHQMKKGKTFAYSFTGYWEDIGTIDSFYKANIALTDEEPSFKLHTTKYPIHTMLEALPPPVIRNTLIKNSLICEGSDISAEEIQTSILGPKLKIGKGSRILASYLFGNDSAHKSAPYAIGESCQIQGCLIDKNVQIGNFVKLINKHRLNSYDGENIYIRDGIIIVTKGARVPDHFEI